VFADRHHEGAGPGERINHHLDLCVGVDWLGCGFLLDGVRQG